MFGVIGQLPIVQQLKHYRRPDLRGDLIAGLTVGVLLIPQGLAYSMLAEMPPVYGLFSATIPLIVYGLLGTARGLAVGPVAIVCLLTATGVSEMAVPGTPEYIALVLQLTLLVGLFQAAAGLLRLGYSANFLSQPVIHGFSSAAALIIVGSQLGSLTGISVPRSADLFETVGTVFMQLDGLHLTTAALGVGSIAVIVGAAKINRLIPGPLVAIAIGTLIAALFGLDEQGVRTVGEIPQGLPDFRVPPLSLESLRMLTPIALTIAFLGFLESYSVSKAVAADHPSREQRINADREFLALGAANTVGAFFNSFPVAGGFGRSAVNNRAGAVSGIASLISASVVLLSLLFLTPLVRHLPNAVLAGLIFVAVLSLIKVKHAVRLWRTDRRDFLVLAATFIATLALGVELGIAIAVALSLFLVVYGASTPHSAVLGRLPGSRHYMNIERFSEAEQLEGVLVFRFDAPLFFGNCEGFEKRIGELVKSQNTPLSLFVLDAGPITRIDSTATVVLERTIAAISNQGTRFCTAFLRGPVRDTLKRNGLYRKIGESNHFMNVADAVDDHFAHQRKEGTDVRQTTQPDRV